MAGLLDPRLQLLLGAAGLLDAPDKGLPKPPRANPATLAPQYPALPPQQVPPPPRIAPGRVNLPNQNQSSGGGLNANNAMQMGNSLKSMFGSGIGPEASNFFSTGAGGVQSGMDFPSGTSGMTMADSIFGPAAGTAFPSSAAAAGSTATGPGGLLVGGGATSAGAVDGGLGGASGGFGAGMGAFALPALFAALIGSGKIIENNNADNPIGRTGLSMLGPSFNQVKADPKLGVTTALGLPFLNGFIRNEKAAHADPEWLPFLKGIF